MSERGLPIPTRDPFTGEPLVVTRLENPASGVAIEGYFSLGWIGRLTPDQLEFVLALLQRRNNLQKLATDLGVAYNTVRARFEAVVEAVGGPPEPRPDRKAILRRLAAGDISVEEATTELGA